MDYLAAWYICRSTQNIEESLKQAFPTWDDLRKHWEVVRACCGLMRGREEVIMHVINLLRERLVEQFDPILVYGFYNMMMMSSLQKKCGIEPALFVKYPSCGRTLSQVLNTAKLVVIENLTGEEYDEDLPCNADIVICYPDLDKYSDNVTALVNSRVRRTLQRHRDHIIVIHLEHESQDVMEQMSSLLPSSSLGYLHMEHCYLSKELMNSLAEMPQLTYLRISGSQLTFRDICMILIWPREGESTSLATQGDLLLAAIKAWNGNSKLLIFNLNFNFLPVSVCHPLLVAIAANCPHLEELDMRLNDLSGCLAGFLQNPPPALRELCLMGTDLQAEDIKSLAATVKGGKLQHLEVLNIGVNKLSTILGIFLQNPPPALRQLNLRKTQLQVKDMESLVAAVTEGKLQHLEVLDLRNNMMSEAAVTPLLHALLNTPGDRKLTLKVSGGFGIIIAPSENKSADHYLHQIRQDLSVDSGFDSDAD